MSNTDAIPTGHRALARYLARLVEEHALAYGDFELSSGARSHYYIDMRKLTLSHHLGQFLRGLEMVLGGVPYDAIGGPESGANQIVGGYMARATLMNMPEVHGFVVRKAEKGHGKPGLIVGNLEPGDQCVVVEDVTTSGASALKAVDAVEAAGGKVVIVVTLLDRLQGARQAMNKRELPFLSLLRIDDITIKPAAP